MSPLAPESNRLHPHTERYRLGAAWHMDSVVPAPCLRSGPGGALGAPNPRIIVGAGEESVEAEAQSPPGLVPRLWRLEPPPNDLRDTGAGSG